MQETVWDFDMMQASDIVLTFLQSVIEDLYFGPFSPFFSCVGGDTTDSCFSGENLTE